MYPPQGAEIVLGVALEHDSEEWAGLTTDWVTKYETNIPYSKKIVVAIQAFGCWVSATNRKGYIRILVNDAQKLYAEEGSLGTLDVRNNGLAVHYSGAGGNIKCQVKADQEHFKVGGRLVTLYSIGVD